MIMKKLTHRMWAKALAMVLCIVSGMGSVACVAGLILYQEILSEKELLDTFYESIASNYSAQLLDNMDENNPEETLSYLEETTGLRYAVICSRTDPAVLRAVDMLDDPELYLYGDPEEADSYCYFFMGASVRADAGYSYNTTSLLQALDSEGYCYYDSEGMWEHYWVLSYVDETSTADDLFSEARGLVAFIMEFGADAAGLEILFLAVFVASLVFLMIAAGRRKEDDEIHLRIWDKIPLGIYIAVWLALEAACCYGLFMIEEVLYGNIEAMVVFITEVLALAAFLALAFCMGISVRVKTKCLWKNTLLYRLYDIGKKGGAAVYQAVREHTSIFWKAVLCLLAAYAVEGFVLLLFMDFGGYGGVISWFVLFAVIRAGIVIWTVLQMTKIQSGGERIAAGDLSTPIDTHAMFWEFKKHAENINKAGDGIALAVENQMKSEHFKTELITNVSHDIKTPLTSIINYVDLIKKEEIADAKLVEYIEVLDRHSARLKKLIEDLMEASKASTGSLPVNMEKCDAAVLLDQAVGEFEERMEAAGLKLVTTAPPQPVQILADGRHLWRVFDNLLNNICKYAQPGTRVYIDLERRQDSAVITFKNISKYQLGISSEELMERFVRGDSSRNTEGSGLGLSIAQSLTGLMGGTFALLVDGDLFKATLSFPALE